MEQLNVPDEMKVPIDFNDKNLPLSVRTFRPLVFQEGDAVCVVLGPDPQEGVFGCGPTKEEALNDWDKNLKLRMEHFTEEDEVVRYMRSVLSESKP
jgi:hypothetical protein